MANTFSQIYVHFIFAVKGKENIIWEDIREELQKYISGIIRNERQKLYAIYCMPDHTHLLISLSPEKNISFLIRDIKANSSRFINKQKWIKSKFYWQAGYCAFTCSQSQVDTIVKYILNQPIHHAERSFKEEYLELLKKFEIEYDEKYLFEFIS